MEDEPPEREYRGKDHPKQDDGSQRYLHIQIDERIRRYDSQLEPAHPDEKQERFSPGNAPPKGKAASPTWRDDFSCGSVSARAVPDLDVIYPMATGDRLEKNPVDPKQVEGITQQKNRIEQPAQLGNLIAQRIIIDGRKADRYAGQGEAQDPKDPDAPGEAIPDGQGDMQLCQESSQSSPFCLTGIAASMYAKTNSNPKSIPASRAMGHGPRC